MKVALVFKGGPGSGHHGHAGIPGKQGGSLPGDGIVRHAVPGQAEQVVVDPAKRELDFNYPIDEKAAAHLNQQLHDNVAEYDVVWNHASQGLRAEVKYQIVHELAKEASIDQSEVNTAIGQWAESSNGNDMRSLSLQEAASDEFGVGLSEWQQTSLKYVRKNAEPIHDPNAPFEVSSYVPVNHRPVNGWSRKTERTFLRTMYTNTQTQLQAAGYKPDDVITLYRGFSTEVKFSPGNVVDYTGNAMESWSISNDVATNFTGGRGISITAQIRVRDILSTARTGFGCLTEGEFVVLGNSRGIQATVAQGNDYYD